MKATAPADLIRLKRDGRALDAAQLAQVSRGIASDQWSEAQVAAFAMAVALRGMSVQECRAFTLALRDSGSCLRWDHLNGPVLDKHSTGGVGDCVSLLLAPMLAACGAYVPMISGRGLGHTGGTLDKLESIPGYRVNPDPLLLRRVIADVGCAIVGQSQDLVPADRRLYSVRDITATVDVPDLIVASILSKKLAGGAQALVLDVKTGSGAQFPGMDAAESLADRMLEVAEGSGLTLRVALTDMNQVLAASAGNALEVRSVVDLLRGDGGSARLLDLSVALAGELLILGGLARAPAEAERRLRRALSSGAAAERFGQMLAALGGPADFLDRADTYLPTAPLRLSLLADRCGYVTAMNVRELGDVVVHLGGGRLQPGQSIDHAVGLSDVVGVGACVAAQQPLAVVHARDRASAEAALARLRAAIRIEPSAPAGVRPLLRWCRDVEVAA
jgi:thymidine phosphorylase